MLTFEPVAHEYKWNGVPVPSVTQVLAPLCSFEFVDADVLEAARDFGTAVHKACELDDLRCLDEGALDPALLPYLMAWRAFCRDYAADWTHVEERVYHPTFRYAGTVDRCGTLAIKGVRYPSVVDLKSGAALYASVGPQLAAYEKALEQPPITKRVGVRLKPDGTYEARFYTEPSDWSVFASLITLRTFCATHNLQPFKELTHA